MNQILKSSPKDGGSSRARTAIVLSVLMVLLSVIGMKADPASAGSGSGSTRCNSQVTLRDGPSRSSFGTAMFWDEYNFNYCFNGREVTSVYVSATNWRVTNVACCTGASIKNPQIVVYPYYASWNGRSKGSVRFKVGTNVSGTWGSDKYIWRDVTIRGDGTYSWTGWGG